MKLLTPAGPILILAGILMIAFARQLGALYEGGTVTMSDLGFIVGGLMLGAIGVVLLLVTIVVGLRRKTR